MNHHLTRIAALPSTAGAGSALIPERNPSRPRFELTAEDMAAAGYPSGYATGGYVVDSAPRLVGERGPETFVPFSAITRLGSEAPAVPVLPTTVQMKASYFREQEEPEIVTPSSGIYSYEAGGLVRIGDADPPLIVGRVRINGEVATPERISEFRARHQPAPDTIAKMRQAEDAKDRRIAAAVQRAQRYDERN